MNLKDVRLSGLRNVNVQGVVLETPKVRQVTTKAGELCQVADILIGDETGECRLTLWNEDLAKVELGNRVTVEYGYTTQYKGEVFLQVGKFGKLTVSK